MITTNCDKDILLGQPILHAIAMEDDKINKWVLSLDQCFVFMSLDMKTKVAGQWQSPKDQYYALGT